MKRSAGRILVTHVGSLVRPTAIREVMAAREQDLSYDAAAFEKTLRQEVANVVRQQAEAGVDIVSDGEYGKAGWIRYVAERLGGFVHREVRPGEREFNPVYLNREAEKFPEFYAAYNVVQYYDWLPPTPGKPALQQAGPTPAGGRKMLWDCIGPISYRGQAAIKQDVDNFKAPSRTPRSRRPFCRWLPR
jgi:5-methyltetrahydropteroyltriglutamate--homocysteine methyltransferase